MKKIIIDNKEAIEACLQSNHYPNAATQKSLKNIEAGKNLSEPERLEEFAKKVGQ